MNLKFSTLLIGLSTLLFLQTKPLVGQQIPASELPPPGIDTGLEGKYDPTNGIAQLIQDKSAESAASKIFEDDHVLVFMPLPEEEVVVPGHVLVVPKRMPCPFSRHTLFWRKSARNPRPKEKARAGEYKSIADKLRAAWPK